MDIYELNRRFREELLHREYKSVRNVLRSYENSWKGISRQLDALSKKIEAAQKAGQTFSPAWLYQEARYRTLLDEINTRYQQLAKECTEFTQAGVKVTAQMGARHALRLGKQITGSFAGLHDKAVESLVASFSRGPVRALFANLGPIALQRGSQILIESLTNGDNPRKAAKLLRDTVKSLTEQRAVLIARTEMIRSYRMATQQSYQLNNDVLGGWRWTCAKTAATCPLCLAMDGEVFPVTETLSSHPACRCAMVPVPRFDFGSEPKETGSEWFKSLPAKAQDTVLKSKTKGDMYRAGGFELKDLVKKTYSPKWGGSYQQRTTRELLELSRSGRLRASMPEPPPLSGYTAPNRVAIGAQAPVL